MQVTLNAERQSFCFIGSYMLSFSEPGPIDVNVKSLTDQEVEQFLFNHRQGYISIDDPKELLQRAPKKVAPKPIIKTEETKPLPTIQNDKPIPDTSRQEVIELRKILSMKIPFIKEHATKMTIGKVKRLLEVERDFRNRKGVVGFLEEIINKHTLSVTNSAIMKRGDIGTAQDKSSHNAVHGKNAIRQYLTNIGEIVESDETTITVNVLK